MAVAPTRSADPMSPSKEDRKPHAAERSPTSSGRTSTSSSSGSTRAGSGAVGHHFARPGQPVLEGAPRLGVHRPAPVPARGRVAARTESRPDEPRRPNHRDRGRADADEIRAGARDSRIGSRRCIPGSSPCLGSARTGRGSVDATRRSDRRKTISLVRGSGSPEPERPERPLPIGRTHRVVPSAPRLGQSGPRARPEQRRAIPPR